jgi:hypothetical protein
MTTVELDHSEPQVDQLERLWTMPATAAPRRRESRAPRVAARLPHSLAVGWVTFVVAVIAFEPAPNAAAVVPLWAELTLTAFWVALPAAALLGWFGRIGPALGVSAVAGCIGVALGYACHASEHHLGAWWLVEAGGCGALGLLSLAALASRR